MFWAVVEIFHMFRCTGAFGASFLFFGTRVGGPFKSMKRHSKQGVLEQKTYFVLNPAVKYYVIIIMFTAFV